MDHRGRGDPHLRAFLATDRRLRVSVVVATTVYARTRRSPTGNTRKRRSCARPARTRSPGCAGRRAGSDAPARHGGVRSVTDRLDVPVRRGGTGADLAAVAAGVLLVAAAAVVGRTLLAEGADLLLPFPPLLAQWLPHAGPGTPVAVVTAAAVVAWGPSAAATLRWGRLLVAAWAAATAWTLALALVDGWQRGVVERLSSGEEYLHDVPGSAACGEMLATFADHILTDQPVHWTTHVGAHPPGVLPVLRRARPDRARRRRGRRGGDGAGRGVGVRRGRGHAAGARRRGRGPACAAVRGAAARRRVGRGVRGRDVRRGAGLGRGAARRGSRRDAGRARTRRRWRAVCCSAPPSTCPTAWRSACCCRRPSCWRPARWRAAALAGGRRRSRRRGVHRVRVLVVHRIRPRARDLRREHRREPALLLFRVGEPRGGVVRRRPGGLRRGAPRGRRAPRAPPRRRPAGARGAGRDRRRRPDRAVEGRGRADLAAVRGVARGARARCCRARARGWPRRRCSRSRSTTCC